MKTSLIIFHRHGQRAPNKGITAAEAELWSKLMCSVGAYPIISHEQNPTPFDEISIPFGNLTKKGSNLLKSVGSLIKDKFFDDLKQNIEVRTLSTNYNRTQYSAQYLLKGIGISEENPVCVRYFKECSM